MPPRGRPPGRKSLNRQQINKAKQQSQQGHDTPTPRKPGRPPRKSLADTPPAVQEIRVASAQEPMNENHVRMDLGTSRAGAQPESRAASPNETASNSSDATTPDADAEVVQATVTDVSATKGTAAEDDNVVEVLAVKEVVRPPTANGHGPSHGHKDATASRTILTNGVGHTNTIGLRGARTREPSLRSIGYGYAAPGVDLDAISYRQLNEDMDAYAVDLDFCDSQLAQPDLTPQESRTLQLRRLDLGHQIRFCQHRREILEAQRLQRGGRPLQFPVLQALSAGPAPHTTPKRPVAAHMDGPGGSRPKRPRANSVASAADTISVHSSEGRSSADVTEVADTSTMAVENGGATYSLQRLGFWKCRLCMSEKYLMAGAGRQPSAPSKWPLKDMGKLMSHYFDMHTEHEPDERCAELGDALDRNRGPFEYWLRKSRAQRITDHSIIDQVVQELQAGRVPKTLRDLCRAAAAFPGA